MLLLSQTRKIANTARTCKNDLLSIEERGVRCIPGSSIAFCLSLYFGT
jgi:hypothetical protein